jgi:hypothetical protein
MSDELLTDHIINMMLILKDGKICCYGNNLSIYYSTRDAIDSVEFAAIRHCINNNPELVSTEVFYYHVEVTVNLTSHKDVNKFVIYKLEPTNSKYEICSEDPLDPRVINYNKIHKYVTKKIQRVQQKQIENLLNRVSQLEAKLK